MITSHLRPFAVDGAGLPQASEAVMSSISAPATTDPTTESVAMTPRTTPRHIALVAHDNMKVELLRWAEYNRETLAQHVLYATGTTGTMLEYELGLKVHRFLSGPVGGDQQIGARIAEGLITMLIFFWDPLEPQPHDPDVKALLRIGTVWNVPMACNVASADLMISSPLLGSDYESRRPDLGPRSWEGAAEPS
jgi:methylglyoxal synthase